MLHFLSIPKTLHLSKTPLNLISHYHPSPKSKQAFTSLLNSNTNLTQLKQIHALLLTTGFTHKNSLLTLLLQSLTLTKHFDYARQLFDSMHKPRVFLWNVLIKSYVRNNLSLDALSLYVDMHSIGVRPDNFTFPFVFKACAELLNVGFGMALHGMIFKFDLSADVIISTELMVMYARFGDSESADGIFENSGVDARKDLVFWNALISAYAQNGNASKAIALFKKMENARIEPDSITIVSVISSCAYLGCLDFGRKLHFRMKEKVKNVCIENALVDMYSKCGSMDEASKVFCEMGNRRNVVSWSTLIGGYSISGDSDEALSLFSQMQNDGVKPNHVTMLLVLGACSHAGLVNEGKKYFNSITSPKLEHYATMVDLFGRSGDLDEAYKFIKNMPIEPDAAVWGALLGSCTVYCDTNLGQIAADALYKLAPDTPSYQVLLSNMYALSKRWTDVEKVRKNMKGNNLKKVAAYSSIELNGEVHIFFEGSHTNFKEIYAKLDELIGVVKGLGYESEIGIVLHDVEVEDKEAALKTHSEKLAIAFSIVHLERSGSEIPLRIMKNLRICSDCHNFFKYASKALGREIVMRDKSRFHHFSDGICSCKDFW